MVAQSIATKAENEAALAALEKRARGEKLTRADINAIRRYEKRRDAEARDAAYERCLGKDLCALLGFTRKQLTRYQGYGAPRNEDGSWNLFVFLPWFVQHERDRLKDEGEKAVDALELQRRAKAQLSELELEEKKGLVGPVEHYKRTIWNMFHGFARSLEAFPRRVAGKLANLDARDHEIRHAQEVREFLAGCENEMVAVAGDEPAKKKGGKR